MIVIVFGIKDIAKSNIKETNPYKKSLPIILTGNKIKSFSRNILKLLIKAIVTELELIAKNINKRVVVMIILMYLLKELTDKFSHKMSLSSGAICTFHFANGLNCCLVSFILL